jgi:non-ribosomal peptide synthetase component F
VDPALTGALRAAARATAISVEVVLVATFLALLHRHTGEEDAVIGMLADGRTTPGMAAVLGCVANPLVLRVDLGGDPSFRSVLARVSAAADEARAHAAVPFAHVVRAVQPRRDPARSPLFSSLVTFAPLDQPPAGWELSTLEIDPGTADFELLPGRQEGGRRMVPRTAVPSTRPFILSMLSMVRRSERARHEPEQHAQRGEAGRHVGARARRTGEP